MPVLNGEKKSSGSENTDSQPPKDELGCSAGDFACGAPSSLSSAKPETHMT